MSKNISEIPLTELIERVMDITRTPENARPKIKAAINDVYTKDIPYKWDWNFLLASSSLITQDEYKTGSVSINTGSTTATFSSDTVLDASSTGKQLKISGNDVVYDFTFSDTTGGTVAPSFQGPSNASSNSYSLSQSEFSLATNFDRFPKEGGVYKWVGGKKEIISEESFQEDSKYFSATPSTPEKIRLIETDTLGRQMIRFRPAPNKARVYGYDYLKKITPMSENSAGTITINAGSSSAIGSASKFLDSAAGDYIRINAFGTADESTWYRISAISSNSDLTLSTAFALTGVTSAGFIISKVPDFPAKLHPAIVYGAVRQVIIDQNDPNAVFYVQKYTESLLDAKKLYVSRVYSQKVSTVAEEFLYRR